MTAITPFLFENETLVRVVLRDDEPWFVAADVCRVLGTKNPTQAIAALDDDERAMLNIGRQGEANLVSEGGMFTLILRCRDAMKRGTTPHRFRKWVTSEVLPSIRKTGAYRVESGGAAEPGSRAVPVLGRSAATHANLDLAEGFLGNHELRVLATIRNFQGADGFFDGGPNGTAAIAKVTGLTFATVDRIIFLLMTIGLIGVVPNRGCYLVPRDDVVARAIPFGIGATADASGE